jgi:hypothetical protein
LFNNGHGEAGADAATAFVADGQDADCVLHGLEGGCGGCGGKGGRLGGLQVFLVPALDGGNNAVASGRP